LASNHRRNPTRTSVIAHRKIAVEPVLHAIVIAAADVPRIPKSKDFFSEKSEFTSEK
jgi:hypothetical protein